jgi:hypothetical protein
MKHPLGADYCVFDEISRPKDNATSLEKSVLNDTYISVLN